MKKKQDKQEKNEISLEELIEEERGKLGTNLTKITLETFSEWKKKKVCDVSLAFSLSFIFFNQFCLALILRLYFLFYSLFSSPFLFTSRPFPSSNLSFFSLPCPSSRLVFSRLPSLLPIFVFHLSYHQCITEIKHNFNLLPPKLAIKIFYSFLYS